MFPDAGFGSLSLSPLGVFSSTSGKTAERMVVGPTAPHGMEGCAALLDKRRASGAATFLSDRDRAGPGSEQSSSCSRERESKVGAESREEFPGRRRGRQGRLEEGTWVEKEPPWWCASLPAAGGAGSTNNYLTISEPGNKQSLASTTTTKEITTTKSKT